jgi:predicted Zn-dependent protease
MRRWVGRGGALLAAAALAGSPAIAASPDFMRPANLRPEISSPEAGLWGASDKAEVYVKRSAELNRDPALNAYVRGLVCKLAADYCGELRVYVLDRPILNAAAAPNGYLEVNSGLLLRARSEDELAFVLGHEIAHFGRNHTIEQWSRTKRTANTMLALQIVVTAGAAAAAYSSTNPNSVDSISQSAQAANDLIYLVGIASIFAYGREHENDADRVGFRLSTTAGYDKSAPARMWTEVTAENASSDFPSVRKAPARASMFATHPVNAERVTALTALAGEAKPADDTEARRRYRAIIRPHLNAWLRDDLRRRDFGQTLHLIARLSDLGEDKGLLAYYRGECLRQRRTEGDAAAALAAYAEAVQQPDAPALAYRELGAARKKAGDRQGAADAYRDYIAKAPDADDLWLVRAELDSLTKVETK